MNTMANTSDKPKPAMALLGKYTQMHNDIDEAREEASRVRSKIDQTHKKINELRQERTSLEDDIEREKEKYKQMAEETETVLTRAESLQRDKVQLSSDIVTSKQKLETTKQSINDYRQVLIQESRDFRSSCKRLCTRVGLVRLSPKTPLLAYSIVKQQQKQNGTKESRGRGNDASQYQEIILAVTRSNNKEDKGINDEAMVEALRKKNDAKVQFLQADQAREELRTKKNLLEEKTLSRETRKHQLQSQLSRIQNEINELQHNIAKIEEDTLQAREMGANFKKEVEQRKQHEAKKAASSQKRNVSNPYGRSKSSTNSGTQQEEVAVAVATTPTTTRNFNPITPGLSSSRGKSTTHRASISTTQNSNTPTSSSHSQHPHRVGRVRSSRQFGSSLSIRVPPKPITTQTTRESNIPNNINGDGTKSSHRPQPRQDPLVDSDSDDDDEILGFVAFANKNKGD